MVNLTFDRVSKKYKIYAEPNQQPSRSSLVNKLRRRFTNHSREFWALQDVSFDGGRLQATLKPASWNVIHLSAG